MNALQNFFLALLGPDGKATELTLPHIALRGLIIFIVGLAIVRKGVERMNGRVGLESAPGKGSRFWIELPAATTPAPAG